MRSHFSIILVASLFISTMAAVAQTGTATNKDPKRSLTIAEYARWRSVRVSRTRRLERQEGSAYSMRRSVSTMRSSRTRNWDGRMNSHSRSGGGR